MVVENRLPFFQKYIFSSKIQKQIKRMIRAVILHVTRALKNKNSQSYPEITTGSEI